MIGLLAVLACSCLISAAPQLPQAPRIVGGETTFIEEYPYQASLQYRFTHVCGAVVISENYVLTAAHCTDGVEDFSKFRVRAGTTYLGTGGLVVSIAEVYQNPNFNDWIFDYDISIIKLASPLSFGSAIQPVSLPKYGEDFATGTIGSVTGWGRVSETESTSSQLQVVSVPLVSLDECKADYGSTTVTDRMVCAGYPEGGKDACQGDSGGPLVVNGVLIGIYSYGHGCALPNYPSIYTNVLAFRNFISEVTGL